MTIRDAIFERVYTGIGIIYYCVLRGIVTTRATHIKYAYDVTSCVTMYVNVFKKPS